MSKLKFSFLVLMLMVSVSASADWAPADVQAALKKMYPTADGVAWSHDESYYVADFLMNGFDTKVWFDGQAQWVMQQTDWETMDEVPPAVYNAFAASEYSGGMGAECHLGTVSQMAVHRGGRGRDGKSPDEISDIVYPDGRNHPCP